MQRTATKTLFGYWNKLRGSRSAPERKNVDPTQIRHALSNTFILETSDEQGLSDGLSQNYSQEFSFRLAGSHLCSTYCRELKGRTFESFWSAKDRDAIKTLLKAVTQDHAVALVTFEGTSQTSNKMTFETILLPLRHNGSSTNRILGAMSSEDEPYWFGAQPIIEQRISGLRLIWPDDLSLNSSFLDVSSTLDNDVQFDPSSGSNFAGEATLAAVPAKVHGISARRYSHLSVIDGGLN